MSSEAIQISDNRIAEINKLYDRFRLWGDESSGVDGADANDVVRQIWALEDKEGYWSERGQLASDMTHVAASHRDMEATRAWAVLSHTWFSHELGEDSAYAMRMAAIAREPQRHPQWGKREKMSVGMPTGLV